MNIALIGVFDGKRLIDSNGRVRLTAIQSFIADRLDRAPSLRRVLLETRRAQGRPAWADAQGFRVEDHVVLADPGHEFGDESEFLAWCAQRSVIPLDRTRPLWRMDIVPGLPDGRVGVLVVVHHVVADGLRGVDLIGGLFDRAPDLVRSPAPWRPAPEPTGLQLVADNVSTQVAVLRGLRSRQLRQGLQLLEAVRAERLHQAPPSPLGGPIGPGRQLLVVRQLLEELRAVAHGHGCTINDCCSRPCVRVCASCCSSRGSAPRARAPRIGAGRRGAWPSGRHDRRSATRRHLRAPGTAALHRRRDQQAQAAAGRGSGGHRLDADNLARLGVLWARRTASTHINLYVTNVAGPPFPLYLAGSRLEHAVPLAPLIAGVKLSVTALSYDGVLSVSLLADQAIDGLATLANGVQSGFDTYSALASTATARA